MKIAHGRIMSMRVNWILYAVYFDYKLLGDSNCRVNYSVY